MKMVKKLPLLLLAAAPYFVPMQSRANWWDDLFGGDNKENNDKDKPPHSDDQDNQDQDNQDQNDQDENDQGQQGSQGQPGGNSVPLNGGVVFLVVAGLGLGGKLLYDAKAKKKVAGGL